MGEAILARNASGGGGKSATGEVTLSAASTSLSVDVGFEPDVFVIASVGGDAYAYYSHYVSTLAFVKGESENTLRGCATAYTGTMYYTNVNGEAETSASGITFSGLKAGLNNANVQFGTNKYTWYAYKVS